MSSSQKSSTATVATERPGRYGKQLWSLLTSDGTPGSRPRNDGSTLEH